MEDNYEEETTELDVLREIFVTERSFYGIVRLLDANTRNNVVAAHMRNINNAISLLRLSVERPPATMVMNIDLSGNVLRGTTSGSFFDPVPVAPTPAQIAAGTETHMAVPAGTTCAICQEEVTCATRLRTCGHSFHGQCISQWLGMNPRCPVCRHDIRLTTGPQNPPNEGNRVHTNE
jgi:hypothetical protein